ncbi:uncharacterized protein [Gorilla gorilla gorilla]|uniref:uncharacterized protein n=1 Tax=Gorilla gorilla gorilla TaxID=9595 RepID=UPI00300A247A
MRSRHFLRGRVRSGVTLFLPSPTRLHTALGCESLIQKGHEVRQRCRTGMGLEEHAGGMRAIWVTARGSSAAHSFSSPGPHDGFHLGHLPLERLLLAKSTPPETDGEGDSSVVPVLGLAFCLLPPTAQVERGGPCPYRLESIRLSGQCSSAFSSTREAAVCEDSSFCGRRKSRETTTLWVVLGSLVCWLSPTQAQFALLICYVFLGQLLWSLVHSEHSSVPFQGSLPGSHPTRECGLGIKAWRAASYCHLTQSLITLAYLSPLSVLGMGSHCGSLFPFTKV